MQFIFLPQDDFSGFNHAIDTGNVFISFASPEPVYHFQSSEELLHEVGLLVGPGGHAHVHRVGRRDDVVARRDGGAQRDVAPVQGGVELAPSVHQVLLRRSVRSLEVQRKWVENGEQNSRMAE